MGDCRSQKHEVIMRTKFVTGVLIGAIAFYWVRSTEGQVQPVPGPGSGVVTVQGQVDVGRLPPLDVRQGGDWKVSLAQVADVRVANTPAVAMAPLAFLKVGGRYEITWPTGHRDVVGIAQLGSGGWIRAFAAEGRQRWVNLAGARSVEEVP
jgi:hypothetical protein